MSNAVRRKEREELMADAKAFAMKAVAGIKDLAKKRSQYKKLWRAWLRKAAIAGGPCSVCRFRRSRPGRINCACCADKQRTSPNREINRMRAELEKLRKVRDEHNALLARLGKYSQ